ncbi:MAG: hypothetical protein MZU97_18775 [Bacillus subtilis]|nr:hypothetical protein [Bacillus subtilis]
MILGQPGGYFPCKKERDADITAVIDPSREFTVDPERFASLGKEHPLPGLGAEGSGRSEHWCADGSYTERVNQLQIKLNRFIQSSR